MTKNTQEKIYRGFEQGPIRPPSEAESLLVRVTRNCPWNRCTFCPVYKGEKFSLRPVEHVIRDIDAVWMHIEALRGMADQAGNLSRSEVEKYASALPPGELAAFQAALHWYASGMTSVFLQDANSLVIKPENLVAILAHIRKRFPWVSRITSYARSHTVARISDDDLAAMARSGLNRIHIGMESGSDKVLAMVKKGATKALHIKAGKKVKKAGIELSEYVMPGLGGRELSHEHALQTADALNQIDPDFIRIRSLAIPRNTPLYEEYASGRFKKLSDTETAKEIRLFLENLHGINSRVKSDHILNLFEEIEGKLPEDKERMICIIDRFFAMDPEKRMRYQVGRRLGYFRRLEDALDPSAADAIDEICRNHGITPENADRFIDDMMRRYI